MGITVAFSNQKGGVGKTTLSRELGIYLASVGLRVLLVDADPQGNLTKSLLEEVEGPGLFEALSGEKTDPVEPAGSSLWLLGGDVRLAALEKSLVGELDGYLRLRRFLERYRADRFEAVLIDSPPSLGLLSVNALVAADGVVIPMTPTLYSLQGTNDLLETVKRVREAYNPQLELFGVILNAWDSVPVIGRQLRVEIEEAFGEKMFPTVLSRSIKLEEAIAGRHGVIRHPKLDRSRAKREVEALGEELLIRMGHSVEASR